jgi:DNA-binding MarR family transcriptional regulator
MPADDPLQRTELTFLLGMAFQLVLHDFVRRLDTAGYADLRPIHGLVFQALGAAGATGTELAERLGVTKQAASQIVDYLDSRGYVRRQPHPGGGRRRLIVLTAKGQEHLAFAGHVLQELEGQLATRVDQDAGLLTLRRELVRLIRGLAGDALPPLRPIW